MTSEPDQRAPTHLGKALWAIGVLVACVLMVAYQQHPLTALVLVALMLTATWLSAIDLATHRLPNKIVGSLSLAVVLTVGIAGVASQDMSRTGRAIAFGLAASTLFLLANLIGGMGMGDVKYAFPLVTSLGWFGWQAIATAAMVTALTGAAAATAAMIMGRGSKFRLPYGPFMSIGLAAGLLRVAPW